MCFCFTPSSFACCERVDCLSNFCNTLFHLLSQPACLNVTRRHLLPLCDWIQTPKLIFQRLTQLPFQPPSVLRVKALWRKICLWVPNWQPQNCHNEINSFPGLSSWWGSYRRPSVPSGDVRKRLTNGVGFIRCAKVTARKTQKKTTYRAILTVLLSFGRSLPSVCFVYIKVLLI